MRTILALAMVACLVAASASAQAPLKASPWTQDAGRAAEPIAPRDGSQRTDPQSISRSQREDCGPRGGTFDIQREPSETTSNSRECIDTSGRPTGGSDKSSSPVGRGGTPAR